MHTIAAGDFNAVQRRLTLYLIALWGRSFSLAGDAEHLPSIQNAVIRLPICWTAAAGMPVLQRYRAAAAHAAAHQIYGSTPFVANGLKVRQRALIALMEDARVESMAMQTFPGLRRLWSGFHQGEAADGNGFDSLLARLGRAIIDSGYRDTNPWVQKGVDLYFESVHQCRDPQAAYKIGMQLANDIGQLRIPMNESVPPCIAAYHDDHQHLWVREHLVHAAAEIAQAPASAASRSAHLIEQSAGKLLPFAAEQPWADAPAGWSIHSVEADAALEFNAHAINAVPAQYRYPEWDYRIGLSRPDWVTVHERMAQNMPAGLAERLLVRHAHLLAALERIVGALRQQGRARLRRQFEGDDVDLDAAIGAAVELRHRHVGEPRVYLRQQIHSRQDVTVLLLLDLSTSANDRIADSHRTILELTCDASLLLAVVLERLGERFAVHGFSSNGRHEVNYLHFKNFEEPCDAIALDRVAGMRAGLSTRLGAALRHAGDVLSEQPGERRLLLVLTDGQPSDIDVYDARYLIEDARNAVVELRSSGIQTFCMNLDTRGNDYAARIFGPTHYEVLEQVERLPEKLPRLVLALTRRH
ncbi:MAG: VWA domain-containing protein [Gammaproteobacteria bacterium]|nr:VWA domain-containing protein [Gammaproteobacteria bacterium]